MEKLGDQSDNFIKIGETLLSISVQFEDRWNSNSIKYEYVVIQSLKKKFGHEMSRAELEMKKKLLYLISNRNFGSYMELFLNQGSMCDATES